mgnify:CR=1 FL=1
MFINNLDPVAINFFSFEIKWYSLSYIFGIILGWIYCKKIIKDKNISILFDDLISYLIIGIISELNASQLLYLNPNKICNYTVFNKIGSKLMTLHKTGKFNRFYKKKFNEYYKKYNLNELKKKLDKHLLKYDNKSKLFKKKKIEKNI